MNTSKKTINYLIFILLLAGISILFFPFFKMTTLTEKIKKTQYVFDATRINQKEVLFQTATLEPPTMKQILGMSATSTYASILTLPKLDKVLPVSNDGSATSFLAGVVEMYPTRNPMKDNIVILGHHLSESGLLFGDIGQLRRNDRLRLETLNREYDYTVSDVYITDEKNVSVLESSGVPRLTLITCDQPSYTQNRVVVEAELLETRGSTRPTKVEDKGRIKRKMVHVLEQSSKTDVNWQLCLIGLYLSLVILLIRLFLMKS